MSWRGRRTLEDGILDTRRGRTLLTESSWMSGSVEDWNTLHISLLVEKKIYLLKEGLK